uniref:Uncharacterized protein n=1 Tax=Anguilla anguilla TaxID=7936 RepID=A0A0E9TW89_ANGAN
MIMRWTVVSPPENGKCVKILSTLIVV